MSPIVRTEPVIAVVPDRNAHTDDGTNINNAAERRTDW